MSKPSRLFLTGTCLLALLAVSLSACIPTKSTEQDLQQLQLEQTKVVIAITQTALSQPAAPTNTEVIPPTDEPVPTEEPTATATIEPSPTLEPTPAPDVDFQGISFSYDDTIASGVSAEIVPSAIDEYGFPGGTYPDYYEFTLTDYVLADTFHQPVIRIYPVEEYKLMSEQALGIISLLEDALIEKPNAGFGVGLPFLPMWNAAMMFTASSSYFPFQNGEGVRYLTMFGQGIYPIDNTNLFYTYQGLTLDKSYYISAIMPISNPALPLHGEDTVEDWADFSENFLDYLSEAIFSLEAYPPESFTPTLSLLDEMMASFLIEPTE